ncbi:MAG: hypothetical protein EOP52_03210 [Sphingobacteriales bacterium]|nr:MAG: hypothetical protein EOP52_03210 [Sphingobacteriales bacterium]
MKSFFTFLVLLGSAVAATAQDDLLNALGTEQTRPPLVIATFKTTRLVTGPSTENVARGVLDFRISHRFNTLKNGASDFFGLDGATTMLSLDYGITDRIMVGLSRSSFNKEIEGYTKIKLLRQRTSKMPLSVSYVGAISERTNNGYNFSQNLSYTHQLLIARKFGERFSAQLSPTIAHYNLVNETTDPNTIYSVGIGGRFKLSRRVTLNAEYYPVLGERLAGTTNAVAIGFDIETGGHVFQLHFTNSAGMTQRSHIGETTGRVSDGDIRFGFNISRVFTIVKPKGIPE